MWFIHIKTTAPFRGTGLLTKSFCSQSFSVKFEKRIGFLTTIIDILIYLNYSEEKSRPPNKND